jgi:acetyl esterase/lipase
MIDAQRAYIYKTTDQARLFLYLYLPSDWQEGDHRAGIVFFFGGGWRQGTANHFSRQAQYLAERGMVAACADYRVKSRQNVLPDSCVEDAKSAVRWMRAHADELGLDPQRLMAAGGSAGGHLAACTATIEGFEADDEDETISSVPDALALFNPALDLSQDLPGIVERFGSMELARALSPNLYIEEGLPPTVVFHGQDDAVVPVAQSESFAELMEEAGNCVELHIASGEGHGFFNRSPWFERTLYRLDQFLASLGYLEGEPTVPLLEENV